MTGPQPYIIMKESGERVPFPSAILEGYERGELIREGEIPEAMRPAFFTLRDAVYGAAVGDALGVPYEFMGRDSFECSGVAGALAGAVYGYREIPEEWLRALRGKDIIEQCLFPGFEKVRNWGD